MSKPGKRWWAIRVNGEIEVPVFGDLDEVIQNFDSAMLDGRDLKNGAIAVDIVPIEITVATP